MAKTSVKPYLIMKDDTGVYSIMVRKTRFNSQGYPLVTETKLDGTFPTMTTARAYIKQEFRAETTDIATK